MEIGPDGPYAKGDAVRSSGSPPSWRKSAFSDRGGGNVAPASASWRGSGFSPSFLYSKQEEGASGGPSRDRQCWADLSDTDESLLQLVLVDEDEPPLESGMTTPASRTRGRRGARRGKARGTRAKGVWKEESSDAGRGTWRQKEDFAWQKNSSAGDPPGAPPVVQSLLAPRSSRAVFSPPPRRDGLTEPEPEVDAIDGARSRTSDAALQQAAQQLAARQLAAQQVAVVEAAAAEAAEIAADALRCLRESSELRLEDALASCWRLMEADAAIADAAVVVAEESARASRELGAMVFEDAVAKEHRMELGRKDTSQHAVEAENSLDAAAGETASRGPSDGSLTSVGNAAEEGVSCRDDEFERKREETEGLKRQLRELRSRNNKQVQEFEARITRLEKSNRKLVNESTQLKSDLEAAESRHSQTRELNLRLGREVQQARRDRAAAQVQNGQLGEEVQRARHEGVAAAQELQTARRDLSLMKRHRLRSLEDEVEQHRGRLQELSEAERLAKRKARQWQERAKVLAWRAQGAEDRSEECHFRIKELSAKERRGEEERTGLMSQLSFLGWKRRATHQEEEEECLDTKDMAARMRRLAREKRALVERNALLEWKLQLSTAAHECPPFPISLAAPSSAQLPTVEVAPSAPAISSSAPGTLGSKQQQPRPAEAPRSCDSRSRVAEVAAGGGDGVVLAAVVANLEVPNGEALLSSRGAVRRQLLKNSAEAKELSLKSVLGVHEVVFNDLPVSRGLERDTEQMTTLAVGARVLVEEIDPVLQQGRVRGRIKEPAGYITIRRDHLYFCRPIATTDSPSLTRATADEAPLSPTKATEGSCDLSDVMDADDESERET